MSRPNTTSGSPTRDFTVAVLIVATGRVVLLWHEKLARWLPPGGHIEPDELPDEAALREVEEETGLRVRLLGERGLPITDPSLPRQLVRPQGIQLEDIRPGHQHIDLVYFAEPEDGPHPPLPAGVGWYGPDEWDALALTPEVAAWCERAVAFRSDADALPVEQPDDRG